MNNDARLSRSRPKGVIPLIALPFVVILLSLMAWVTAVSRSGFWADDFQNVTHFYRSLGDLSNDHINTGKYLANIFWAIGTEAFGAGSVLPFLLLNSLVFATGVVMWLTVGTPKRWRSVDAWWIGGLFLATSAWLPTALWSSNIVHSGGFLALAVALLSYERSMSATTSKACVGWCVATAAAWLLAVMSDGLYIGLLVIAVYCAYHQWNKLRELSVPAPRIAIVVGFCNLLLPLIYFAAIAYPGTTSNSAYAVTGLRFVHENLRFYRMLLAPSDLLTALYAALLLSAIVGAIAALRRRDYFPIAVLGAAAATALPSLVQSQQRDIHYMAMPLLLTFSALAAGLHPLLLGEPRRLKGALLLGALVAQLLIFRQGADIRAFFVQTPYGHSLAAFRSEVAALTPEGGALCATLNLDASHQAFFIAAMSGENGFHVPPISAGQTYFLNGTNPCPANGVAAHITVSLNARGDFVASG